MAVSPNKARLRKLMGQTNTPRRQQVISVTSNTTLKDDQAGSIIFLGGGSATTLTLPAVSAGLHYEVYITTEEQHVIAAATNVMQGNYRHNSDATTMTRVAISNKGTLTLHSTGREIGDRLQFWCDGTNWYVDGIVNNLLGQGTV